VTGRRATSRPLLDLLRGRSGLLSAAPGGDAAERERAGYVNAMRAANASPYGSWS
jgi:hypothetical protein